MLLLARRLIAMDWNPTPAMVPSFRALPGHRSDRKTLAEGKNGHALGELVGPKKKSQKTTAYTLGGGLFHFFTTDSAELPPELRATSQYVKALAVPRRVQPLRPLAWAAVRQRGFGNGQ